jgi:hypothetical protein
MVDDRITGVAAAAEAVGDAAIWTGGRKEPINSNQEATARENSTTRTIPQNQASTCRGAATEQDSQAAGVETELARRIKSFAHPEGRTGRGEASGSPGAEALMAELIVLDLTLIVYDGNATWETTTRRRSCSLAALLVPYR